jgi:hypothetical protein
MELSEEQKRNQASALIMELVQCAVNRGVFSSIEQLALKDAIAIVTVNAGVVQPPQQEDKPAETKTSNRKR